jgi:mannose-6-phosphate isomerase-like protein (cupin superfamily)
VVEKVVRPSILRVVAGVIGYALEPDAGERLVLGKVTILVRASAEQTGGSFSLFEEVPPMVDTPLHVHEREDELFYVLEGEHVFQVGEKEFRLGPGGVAFGPRDVPHAQRRVVPAEGRVLVLTTPGGFDGFFRRLAAAHEAGALGPEAYAEASKQYGITWLG